VLQVSAQSLGLKFGSALSAVKITDVSIPQVVGLTNVDFYGNRDSF
jgi:hypothetical protein